MQVTIELEINGIIEKSERIDESLLKNKLDFYKRVGELSEGYWQLYITRAADPLKERLTYEKRQEIKLFRKRGYSVQSISKHHQIGKKSVEKILSICDNLK